MLVVAQIGQGGLEGEPAMIAARLKNPGRLLESAVGESRDHWLEEATMQLEEKIVGDVAVVTVTGDIVLGRGDVALKDKVHSLIQQGYKKLVLDLGGVSYMDSAGLGELVHVYATVKNKGGGLKLVGLTKRLTDLLTITKLVTVFESYDTEAKALASFSAAV
jgi:anti-sigma B factor antagonist